MRGRAGRSLTRGADHYGGSRLGDTGISGGSSLPEGAGLPRAQSADRRGLSIRGIHDVLHATACFGWR